MMPSVRRREKAITLACAAQVFIYCNRAAQPFIYKLDPKDELDWDTAMDALDSALRPT
jgi:hypothetical protein